MSTTMQASSDPTILRFRPYARLLSMLGDQLIKNERIALIEVIKNAYDADASWVKVSFDGFADDFGVTPASTIVIEDDGVGMSRTVLERDWANPATPAKWLRKQVDPTTASGRVIQGEKGIGRFALLKLGRTIDITTRAADTGEEFVLSLDFSKFGDQFGLSGERPLFLDELQIGLRQSVPPSIDAHSVSVGTRQIIRRPHGTRIEIWIWSVSSRCSLFSANRASRQRATLTFRSIATVGWKRFQRTTKIV
jgi:hypothetical protein